MDKYISYEVNIEFNEILFNFDSGRMIRPLLVISNQDLTELIRANRSSEREELSFDFLHKKRLLEYVDVQEASTQHIAENIKFFNTFKQTRKYTHIEIHPMNMLGWVSAAIPYPEHN